MRNFVKTKLKDGIRKFYNDYVDICKYSHAFETILQVNTDAQPPSLTTDEKNYLMTATWSEYVFESYNSKKRALAPFIQSSSLKPVGSI